jgi:hypothetical protein
MLKDMVIQAFSFLSASSLYTYIGTGIIAIGRHFQVSYTGIIEKRSSPSPEDILKREELLRRTIYFSIVGLILIHGTALHFAGRVWPTEAYFVSALARLFLLIGAYIFVYAVTYRVCKNKCWLFISCLTSFLAILHIYGSRFF